MKAFVWSSLFETGIAEVDAQHQSLVNLVNRLGEEIEQGDAQKLDAVLSELARYTVYHFGSEERVMQESGLDDQYVARHKATHRDFVAQISNWIETRNEKGQLSPSQLLDFLSNWLIFHILGDDQSLGRQLRALQSGLTAQEAFRQDRTSADPRTEVLLQALRHLYADLASRNEMLLSTQASLTQLNATLETRVNERTSELAAANERLMQEQQRAIETEKMASLGRLVAGFAHETNTPVGIAVGAASQELQVIGEIEGLLRQDEVSEQDLFQRLATLKESSGLVMSNLRRAAGMVQSFKRTAVDQSSDDERDFLISEVIQDVLHNLRPVFKKTAIKFDVHCPQALEFRSIPGALTQIITNLCINAHDHAYQEGSREGTIQIDVERNRQDLTIRFKDDGVGIDSSSLPKVFEPFYTTRRSKGGSGLGLYVVYNLVTHTLGGNIECASTLGKGTEFIVRIPLSSTNSPSEIA